MGCCFRKPSKPDNSVGPIATPSEIQSSSLTTVVGSSGDGGSNARYVMDPVEMKKKTSSQASSMATASLRISIRWNLVDVVVSCRPQPSKFEVVAIQVKASGETNWTNAPFEESVPKFRIFTAELKPRQRCQIKCLLRVTQRPGQQPVPLTTQSYHIETRSKMEILPGYQAIREFERRVPNEVSFAEGDVLETVERLPAEIPDKFVYVRNLRTGDTGLAPAVCLVQDEALSRPAVVRHQSYFYANVDKRTAAIMLMRPNIPNGIFLMRPSSDSSAENCIALSVRSGVENGVPILAKFKIYYLSDGYGCFIYPTRTFEDIEALVSYYRNNPIQKNVALTMGFIPPDDPDHQPTIEDIKIPKSSIEYGERLGNGKFGNVFRGKLKHLDVAIKELILPEVESADEGLSANDILEEAIVMARLFHDNIVKFIAVCVDVAPYCLVSEYMNGGSLKKYLATPENRQIMEFETVVYILRQIASGMAYLEARNFLHRDLRADNVLIHQEEEGSLEVKIADFGLSRMVPEGVYESTSRLLPIRWTAPEALMSLQFSLKSDVWSFGIIGFEVCTLGLMPYPNLRSNNDVQRSIVQGVIMTLEECQAVHSILCPETLYMVLKQCWQFSPEKRPDFATLKSTFENFEEATEGQYAEDTT